MVQGKADVHDIIRPTLEYLAMQGRRLMVVVGRPRLLKPGSADV